MKEINVKLTELEALVYDTIIRSDYQDEYVANFVKERIRRERESLRASLVSNYMAEGLQIPTSEVELFKDAMSKGMLKTADERDKEIKAAFAVKHGKEAGDGK